MVQAECPRGVPRAARQKEEERENFSIVNDDHALYMCWHQMKREESLKGDGLDGLRLSEADIVPINSVPKDLDIEYGLRLRSMSSGWRRTGNIF